MAVYVIGGSGVTSEMELVRCKDESTELQEILERNPNLLPGDQIRPDDPRRWLTIRREMPVPDPATGSNRWSIDLFFADQSAWPTFVECKRFEDTRARREVIGQMIEYAANGHYYWTAAELRRHAEISAERSGTSLEDRYAALQPVDDLIELDDYFQRIEANLREGQVRLVFFMERAPIELKSAVEFLNKQMERSEVLIVEARQYRHGELRIVVPSLFGFTEEARLAKRPVTVDVSGVSWDEERFFSHTSTVLGGASASYIRELMHGLKEVGCSIRWGKGKSKGSFTVGHERSSGKTLFAVYSDGVIELYFGHLNGTEELENIRDSFKQLVEGSLSLKLPEDYRARYPRVSPEQWLAKREGFSAALRSLLGRGTSL